MVRAKPRASSVSRLTGSVVGQPGSRRRPATRDACVASAEIVTCGRRTLKTVGGLATGMERTNETSARSPRRKRARAGDAVPQTAVAAPGLHRALDAAGMVAWEWDLATGRVLWAGAHALWGTEGSISKDGSGADDLLAAVHPDDRATVRSARDKAVASAASGATARATSASTGSSDPTVARVGSRAVAGSSAVQRPRLAHRRRLARHHRPQASGRGAQVERSALQGRHRGPDRVHPAAPAERHTELRQRCVLPLPQPAALGASHSRRAGPEYPDLSALPEHLCPVVALKHLAQLGAGVMMSQQRATQVVIRLVHGRPTLAFRWVSAGRQLRELD